MAKPKSNKKSLPGGENPTRRILAQVRILNASQHLQQLQRLRRRQIEVFAKLEKVQGLPDREVRKLLATLKTSDLRLADELREISKNLALASNLLNPRG